MRYMRMSYFLAMACAKDAGNRSMRTAGRTVWDSADYNANVREFDSLWHGDRDTGHAACSCDAARCEFTNG